MGSLAFWIDQSLGIYEAWNAVWLLFSGYLLPIELLPPAVERVARVAPFRFMTSFPVEIVTAGISPGEMLRGFLLQGGWVLAFLLLSRRTWRSGIRRYGAFGA
ncbi:MAG: hypothetical protein D6795_18790 [Deltaproteobacteria bacterium]|nr:MAG: hypothetical protein D6795_18790 [Deltaproteobacteria bacterium]